MILPLNSVANFVGCSKNYEIQCYLVVFTLYLKTNWLFNVPFVVLSNWLVFDCFSFWSFSFLISWISVKHRNCIYIHFVYHSKHKDGMRNLDGKPDVDEIEMSLESQKFIEFVLCVGLNKVYRAKQRLHHQLTRNEYISDIVSEWLMHETNSCVYIYLYRKYLVNKEKFSKVFCCISWIALLF